MRLETLPQRHRVGILCTVKERFWRLAFSISEYDVLGVRLYNLTQDTTTEETNEEREDKVEISPEPYSPRTPGNRHETCQHCVLPGVNNILFDIDNEIKHPSRDHETKKCNSLSLSGRARSRNPRRASMTITAHVNAKNH